MRILFILFIVIPIVEMWVLIQVGARIGALPTIGLVLLTAVIGVALLRAQGLSTLLRANQRMNAGQIPAREMGEGLFLAVGGALLLTPGFVTDGLGFMCLIPGVRRWLLKSLMKRVQVRQFGGTGPFDQEPFEPGPKGRKDSRTIEGEYRRDD